MPFNDDIKNMLEEKLFLSKYLTTDNISNFYNAMSKYFSQKRFSYAYFADLLTKTIEFCQFLDFNQTEIIQIIANHPAIIHANKKDLLAKYLLIGVLKEDRKDIFLNHPKYLLGGIGLLNARYNYLVNHGFEDNITKYYLLKMTNQEFAKTFKISSDQLKAEYSIKDINLLINNLATWPENQDLKEKIAKFKSQEEIKYS